VSPSTVGVASRRDSRRSAAAAARRRAAVRRRNRILAGVALAAVVVGVLVSLPLVQKTVNEFSLPLTNAGLIRQQAIQKHLDPALIAAVIYTETKFDPRSSAAGAEGLMQIMPQTAEFLAHRSGATTFTTADLGTPAVNIAYGSYYLRYLLNEYHGNTTLALAAYNGGESNVDRWIADARAQGHGLTIAEIPFPETRAYVTRVLSAQQRYRRKYAAELYG
jgi:peptidoglycan lytic transglycosylase